MSFTQSMHDFPQTPHKNLEKLTSVATVGFGLTATALLFRTSLADTFTRQAVPTTVFLVGFLLISAVLGWLQQYRYAQRIDKRHPLDERQLQLRLKVFYTSFFVVSIVLSFFIMLLVTDTFSILSHINPEGSSLTAVCVLWLCYTTPSCVAAWTKGA